MNPARYTEQDYIKFLIASFRMCTCTEAAWCIPDSRIQSSTRCNKSFPGEAVFRHRSALAGSSTLHWKGFYWFSDHRWYNIGQAPCAQYSVSNVSLERKTPQCRERNQSGQPLMDRGNLNYSSGLQGLWPWPWWKDEEWSLSGYAKQGETTGIRTSLCSFR